MNKVKASKYIAEKKSLAKQLLDKLCKKYQYASVLVTDNLEKSYTVSRNGISVINKNRFGGKGMVVKVYDGKGYAEYSVNDITEASLDNLFSDRK